MSWKIVGLYYRKVLLFHKTEMGLRDGHRQNRWLAGTLNSHKNPVRAHRHDLCTVAQVQRSAREVNRTVVVPLRDAVRMNFAVVVTRQKIENFAFA